MRALTIAVLVLAVSTHTAVASSLTVNLDPGPDGSSYLFKDFIFTDLAGTNFDGQSLSLDVVFSGAFLVTPFLTVGLDLNQASALGVWPTTGFAVSGYLLDENGLAAGGSTAMPLSAQMPGQLHPGWPYTLPGGQHYLPATTGYETKFQGDSTMAPGALIMPIIFSGIHFDITFPDSPDTLVGSRLSISSFGSGAAFRQRVDSPILVSPETTPTYTVPDLSSTGVLLSGGLFLVLCGVRRYR